MSSNGNLVELEHLTKRFAVKQGVFARGARGDRNEIPQMLACCEFRNHAAIFRMQLRLRRNNIGENFSVVND